MISIFKFVFHNVRHIIPIYGRHNIIKGISLLKLYRGGIWGSNNSLLCESNGLGNVRIRCHGCDHKLSIGRDVIYKRGNIKFEDNGCSLTIGAGTTIEEASFFIAEPYMAITIGNDCMLSEGIVMYTTDGHTIIDMNTGIRTNNASSITIGNHVWIGSGVKILKGVTIGDDAIIASGSIVTSDVPNNTIYAGVPARLVKNNINWKRERI